MSRDAAVYRWSALESDQPMPQIDRRRVIGTHAMLSHLVLGKGIVVPVHAHENEQFAIVLDGHVRFTLEDDHGATRTADVRAGEMLHLPPNVRHGATAVETSTVIDVFAPPSDNTGVDAPRG